MITNRPRRLVGVSCVGMQRYFVTTCTAFRRPVFTDGALAERTIAQILAVARESQFATAAYCLMPDHLHLLLLAQTDAADLERTVKRLKQ